ncbi:LysR substrate-binding domain-containing protein [Pseudomonas matsuisoli]|uniref:LysR substrate-binding domain-containing protein n=1 Tax=Pseudomonas matsuisoli TaxID=1515666 RepID=UPI00166E9FF4|nr:LysR substrate-binding domain-containing protein [Pseudomonas matsuisoli]
MDPLSDEGQDVDGGHPRRPALHNWLRLRHLLLIETLGRTANMHAAAQSMGLSQPAVSKMLRDIEDLLGVVLFERRPRELAPTELGRAVIEYAQRTLNDSQRFERELANLRRGGYGQLRVGAIFAATANALPEAILRIKRERPLLAVELVEQTSDHLLAMLERKELDLVVGRYTEPDQQRRFSFEPLYHEPFVLTAGAGHPLAEQRAVSGDALLRWPWVLYPSNTPLRRMLEHAFAEADMGVPTNSLETTSVQTTLKLLECSQAIALLPESIIRTHLAEGRLCKLDTALNTPTLGYGLLLRIGEPTSANAQAFARILRDVARLETSS